jgi:SAM-dependent methyltransferase
VRSRWEEGSEGERLPSPVSFEAQGACIACGSSARSLVADADAIAAEREAARRFHGARLVRVDPGELQERASFTQEAAANVVACDACGLLARDPLPTQETLEERYADDAYPAWRLEEMLAAQVASFRRTFAWLRRTLGQRGRVVEIGSFVGGFLDVARTAGWRATGIDAGRQVAAFCLARGLDVHAGTVEEFEASQRRVPLDCVAVWNTFDQLAEPAAVLDFAARWLRPGGVLALRVPHGLHYRRSAPRLRSRSMPRRRFAETCLAWNNLLGFPYLFGYGLESLDRLVASFGFTRAAARGDVLCTLAGRATADWARREETACKQLQRAAIRLEGRRAQLAASPWIEVAYRA